MRPFRKNVALAVDGGGIRGVIVTRALMKLEEALGLPVHQIFRLTAGTSTGSIIAAGTGVRLTARKMYELYVELGPVIFPRTWRSLLWPLTRYRYENTPLVEALKRYFGDAKMSVLWTGKPSTDLVITAFDLVDNRTLFIKPWKSEYREWPVWKAVLASSTVPTYFPAVDGRYLDGGVGSYSNPCYLAAYESRFCLNWDPRETTLISLGTGRNPRHFDPNLANNMFAWQWINPVLDAFQRSADDQQVHLVDQFFEDLDFRRFQIDLDEYIGMDDVDLIPKMTEFGDRLGEMILNDEIDESIGVVARRAPTLDEWE